MIHDFGSWIREASHWISAAGIPRRRLDEVGWVDFQSDPPPATQHLREFVSTAIELCCFDDDGSWVRLPGLLVAFVRAAKAGTSIQVSDEDLGMPAGDLKDGVGKMEEIRFWFQIHFLPLAK